MDFHLKGNLIDHSDKNNRHLVSYVFENVEHNFQIPFDVSICELPTAVLRVDGCPETEKYQDKCFKIFETEWRRNRKKIKFIVT